MFKNVINDIAYKFSLATGLAVLVIDIRGNEMSPRYNFTRFCKEVRKYDHLCDACKRCDMIGGLESLKTRNTQIYRCHTGLIDFAIPVVIHDILIGFVMCGQIKLSNIDEIPHITNHRHNWSGYSGLKELYDEVQTITMEKISAANDILRKVIEGSVPAISPTSGSVKITDDNVLHVYSQSGINNDIERAITFINNNLQGDLSLNNVSYFVDLSPYHFSRKFKSYVGYGFSCYVNKQRISEAKSLLSSTELTVESVSKQSGFNNPSYFIKKFGESCGVPPAEFRRISVNDKERESAPLNNENICT
jgi:ligand-binding sensor protein/AraC-like DNA-binding protein